MLRRASGVSGWSAARGRSRSSFATARIRRAPGVDRARRANASAGPFSGDASQLRIERSEIGGIVDGLPPKTRVVLVNMPVLQREILTREFAAEPDIEIVDGAPSAVDLTHTARDARAEFVITGAAGLALDAVARVLDVCPGVKVLALSESGRQGLLYELRPHRVPLEDLSSAAVVETIRRARRTSPPNAAVRSAQRTGSNGKRR